jgi:hypothetical protein
MNNRTRSLFAAYPHGMIEENTIAADPQTVTPGIKDASVANQMALWDETQWGMTNIPANDITHSAYIFGDYDPTTIPGVVNGVKTEDAGTNAGIMKFTDLIENFSQSTHISAIDNLPIGSLIWDDSLFANYNSAADYKKVIARYVALGGTVNRVKETPAIAQNFTLSQNYPNPFNPSTSIRYSLPSRSTVRIVITNTLGQQVAVIENGEREAGVHEVEWHAYVASGIYFYRINAVSVNEPMTRFMQAKKMLLLR